MSHSTEQEASGAGHGDAALLARIALRDRDALVGLYESYHTRLFKFVFRLTSSYTIAEELANDVMLVAWEKAASFRGDSKVSTWLFGIAYRLTMRRVTRDKMRQVGTDEADELSVDSDQHIETEDWVLQGIYALPAAQQLTVVLVYYLGLSYEETAKIADCPVNTIKTRMFHARKKLKSILRSIEGNHQASMEDRDE